MTFPGGDEVVLQGVAPAAVDGKAEAQRKGMPCFASGTAILTSQGECRVENIAAGDLVLTADGAACPVIWRGAQVLDRAGLALRPDLAPVFVAPGVLGNREVLRASPQHCFALRTPGGTLGLAPARHMVEVGLPGTRLTRGCRGAAIIIC